ncbi:MAG: trans-sulfuration enzyme family protein [bacterium]
MSERKIETRLDTEVVHAGELRPRVLGAIAMPVFQSATFENTGDEGYYGVRYIRLNNTPNHDALHAKIAALERAEAAIVASSGMAAISSALLAILSSGDHLLAQDCLYGGTYDFVTKDFAHLGLAYDFIDPNDTASWEAKLRPNTKAIYVEAMTNPTLQVADLEAAVRFARAHGLVSVIDATFASPVNYRAIEAGFDLSLHSCTKYMNGHSDIVAGSAAGSAALVEKVARKMAHLGGSLDPHACFLLHRGIKTLALRVRHQNASALAIAEFLAGHAAIARVNYAGLASHPNHARARKLFAGFGGVMSFELRGGLAAADRFMQRVTIPAIAPSLGGVETLMTRPAQTSHAGLTPAERASAGIPDALVRLSVGIEAADDLIADFAQALAV